MIAAENPQRVRQLRRVISPHFDTVIAKPSPVTPRRVAEPAEPIVDQLYLDALLRFFDQPVCKDRALLVVVDDVSLKKYAVLGRIDRLEPCRIILRRVDKETNIIPVDQPRAGDAFERLVDEIPVQNGKVYHLLDRFRKPCAHKRLPELYSQAVFCKNYSVQSGKLPSVKILFFGATADAAGEREGVLELNNVSSVGDAVNALLDRHPRLSAYRLLIAVNEEYVSPDAVLTEGDELAIFTAVSGG